MVESSFSPPAGFAADGELPRLHRVRLRPRRAAREASREFSDYVSRRTVLVGGCPAISGDAVARSSRAGAPRPRLVKADS